MFISFVNENETYPPEIIVSYHDLSSLTAIVVDIYWPLLCNGGTVYFVKRVDLEVRNLKI